MSSSNPSTSTQGDPHQSSDQSKPAIPADEAFPHDSTVGAAATAGIRPRDETTDGSSPDIPLAESVEQPTQLGGYRIHKLLGEGGMGSVYAAEDIALRRQVALKTMRPELASHDSARSRFSREAQAAAAVESDHIVRIYFVGEDRGVPFIAMEYLRGKPLNDWMRNRLPASPKHILKIGYETALGLAAAHSRGLVHRDIKPANIWLEAPHGRVKILDFGLARSAEGDVQLTGPGVVVGTPAYMAPEQARGLAVDHRTDLFSLGCVLYHLATGHRPFTGSNTLAVLTSLAVDTPAAPCEVNAALPKHLSDLILRLIAKRPEDRPQSAAEVAEELRRIVKGEAVARPSSEAGPMVDQPVVIAMPVPVAATMWEDIAVTGTNEHEVSAEKPRPCRSSVWPVYAVTAAAALLAAGVGISVWPSLAPTGVATQPPEETAPEKPPPPPPKKPADLIPPMTQVKLEPINLDHLDPKDIPAAERFDWQPKELVAVLGSHRRRMWSYVFPLFLSPDGKHAIAANRVLIDLETLTETTLPRDCLTFLPDGKRVASADGIWELAEPTKEPVKVPINLWGAKFLTDRIVVGRTEVAVIVWLLGDKEPTPLKNFGNAREFLASPNGKLLAIVPESPAENIELYELNGETITRRIGLSGPQGKGRLSFFVNGRLAIISPDQSVHIWDVSLPEPKFLSTIFATPNDGISFACLTGTGSRIVTANVYGMHIWDITSGEPKEVVPSRFQPGFADDNLMHLVVTPDGKTIVTGHLNGAVRVWSVEKDVIVERDPLKQQPTYGGSLAFSADGRTLASISELWKPEIRDLSTRGLDRLPVPDDFTGGLSPFSPDGRILPLIGGGVSLGISLWQIAPKSRLPQRSHRFGNDSVVSWSPDGKWLAAAEEKELVVWDVSRTNPDKRYHLLLANRPAGVRFSSTGQYLLVTSQPPQPAEMELTVYAITERGLISQSRLAFPHNSYKSWKISPDGKTIARGHDAGLELFDFQDGKLASRCKLPGIHSYSQPDFSPDGKTLAVGRGNQVQLLDAADGKLTRVIPFAGAVMDVQYHPDGRHLFVTGSNHVIYILRLAPTPEVAPMPHTPQP